MFLIVDLDAEFRKSCAGIFKICIRTKFRIPNSDDSLVMAITPIAK
jgi:hypothetical protein